MLILEKVFFCLLFAGSVLCLSAQGSIDKDGGKVTITWDATTAGISNGAFTAPSGMALVSNPGTGELDSDGVHIQNDESSAVLDADGFDATNDYSFRGTDNGATNVIGEYAFSVGGTNNTTAWGVQPTGGAWSDAADNGHMVIKYNNNAGVTLNWIKVEYEVWNINDEAESTTVELYITDQAEGGTVNYGSVRASTASGGTADVSPAWTLIDDNTGNNAIIINDLSIPDGSSFYVRFKIFDTGNTNSLIRDITALDNITVTGASTMALLPVELISFKAQKKGTSVDLFWQTATETNNDYFMVQHSADGRIFENLGKVAGAGTTQEPQQYYFTDAEPLHGINYYRLLQVDYDGRESYHKVVAIKVEDQPLEWQIFPTLASDILYLEWSGETEEQSVWQIFDANGVFRKSFAVESGFTSHQLDISGLTSGHYFIRLTNENTTMIKRFTKY